ncbi:O-antigen ligase family protein [Actinobacillus pleuropneumoniae]|uniref:O-antigen ligase family protein n=3 Tax=Actinobacillus pleuropneumoniae TaxID=715 RepID=A0A9Q4H6D6_ACTPL|nr:O-antigen ligase family protein [Actinobacillus pleuropneumoniae]ACE62130.1 putative membrane protein [Actinobacillus pleuropneumoniae serovar 7 str. AP76]EFN02273.1 hypothetical protein appser13_15480 [Actinobacillus pleuropneumoniae serovar 13 str. N273]MCL7722160.1 O-antigen ligase family protein [Actinobacillus pleuropneumoniae]MCL7728467.1 O-antigen ligase family protein [Actinobacillus pleuropneumoniae]MCL7729445.1 O-antigen ligase family protein [Actinobacillus pleuropneumoniae]
MQLNKLAINIYFLAIFSLFLPFTAYVPLFLLFIVLVAIDAVAQKEIKGKYFDSLFWLLSFCSLALVTHLINLQHSDITQLIKLIINFSFLSFFIVFLARNNDYVINEIVKKLPKLIELILLLNFIQIVINLAKMNLWMMPFHGIQNSMDAYLIIEPTMYFGTKEKNIWATKIVFVSIIYLAFYLRDIYKISRLRAGIYIFIILFNTLYTFSRTAQLVLIFAIFLYFLWKIFYIYKNVILKIFSFTILSIVSIFAAIIIIDKLLHITLSSGDGLSARFELWNSLYSFWEAGDMNIFLGNGILSGVYIISHYTEWDNNNFHNVFLNIFADMGILGLCCYFFILKSIFISRQNNKVDKRFSLFLFLCPFLVCINSQYLGFDSDIVIYFTLVISFMSLLPKIQYENFSNHSNI